MNRGKVSTQVFLSFLMMMLLMVTVACSSSSDNTPAPPATTYSISGMVSGAIAAGVTINLTGDATATTTTASDGTYSFTGLAAGNYTVIPVKAGYTFDPLSQGGPLTASQTGVDFTATANAGLTYSISGAVSGAVLAGVTITLTGDATGETVTNASGNYSLSGIVNGSYTVTPSMTGYTFAPSSRAATVNGEDVTVPNFVAAAAPDLPIKLFGAGASPWINDIMEDSSNNILVAGTQDDGQSIVVLKITSAGTQVWNKYFPAGTDVNPNNIFEVSSQGYLVTGSIYSTLGSLFIMPIDPDGTNSAPSHFFPDCGYPYWATGPSSSDSVRLSDGSVIFAGFTQYKDNCGTFIDYGNAVITGINSSGTQYFWNDYDYAPGYSENFKSVIALSGGGFAAAGSANLYDDGSGYGGPYNAILVKTDSLGSVIWTKNYGYKTDDLGNAGIIDLIQTSDNGYAMLARSGYYYDIYVIKADSNGNSTSAFNAATGDSCYKGEKFVQSGDNGFVIVGQGAGCHGAVVKMSAAGAKVWEYNLDSGEPTAIVKSASGGYLIAGSANPDVGVYKIFVFKLDDLGKRVW